MVNAMMVTRRALDKLGIRFAIVLAVALLPLMIVSIVRSQTVMTEARSQSEASLDGETLRAVSKELALIEDAKGAAAALAQVMPELLLSPDTCRAAMQRLVTEKAYSFAGFYDPTGYVPCSNAKEPLRVPVDANLREQIENPQATVLVNADAPVSATSVFYASSPVFDRDTSALIGFVAISIRHSALWSSPERHTDDVAFLTLNHDGVVLTSSGVMGDAPNILPAQGEISTYLDRRRPFTQMDTTGVLRTYSVIPVLDGRIYALGTWPEAYLDGGSFYLENPALFPALMWLASLAVAWFASVLLVTGHVVRLRNAMTGFAVNRRRVEMTSFATAPQELRDVAQAHIDMTDKLMQDEAQLEDSVRQKEVLLREVHHRVKNNLQLIASIMNMQMRQSRSPEVKQIMRSLHDRVISLATVHRGLYQTTGLADVSADELLADIVKQVVRIGSADDAKMDIEARFDELQLNPDQAVPLSLLVTEALTNALKYIGSKDGQHPKLRVRLRALEGARAELCIMNTLPNDIAPPSSGESTGLGSQLLEAFCQQLYGDMDKSNDGEWFTLRVNFVVEPLTVKAEE